jgi:hypothetical protein
MRATDSLNGRRCSALAIDIEPSLLPVCSPTFLKSVNRLGGGDTESSNRQDHGANTDVGLRAFADMSTLRTPKNWATDVPFRPNPLKHVVQVVAQLDDGVEGHVLMPRRAQPPNHFWKPHSLRITGGHL